MASKTRNLLWLAGLTAVAGVLYWPILRFWFGDLPSDPDYSYGLLVPPACAFLVYLKIRSCGWAAFKQEISASLWGFGLIAAGCLMLELGSLSTILYFTRLSFVVVLIGIVLATLGPHVLARLSFPLGFLLFAIPIPTLIYLPISVRLQGYSSALAGSILDLTTIPALRQGNIIALPNMSLEVVQACSGIRSLLSLIALGTLGSYLLLPRGWKRLIGPLSAIPIAIVLNGIRIALTAMMSYGISPAAAESFAHLTTGAVIFMIGCFVMMWLMGRLQGGHDIFAREAPVTSKVLTNGSRAWPLDAFAAASVAMMLVLAFGFSENLRPDSPVKPKQPLGGFPIVFSGWSGRDIPMSRSALAVLKADDVLMREYVSPRSDIPVTLYVAYFAEQREGVTMHSPMHCIPGAGWEAERQSTVPIQIGTAPPFSAREVMFANDEQHVLVLYWYLEQGAVEHSELMAAATTLWHAIFDGRSDGCLVRISAPVRSTEAQTLAEEKRFIADALPMLDSRFMPASPSDKRLAKQGSGSPSL